MIMKDSNNVQIIEEKKIAEEFRKTFKQLLGKTVDTTEESITYLTAEPEDKIPNKEEIEVEIKMLKNNKAPGEDSIISELLKNGGQKLIQEIWDLLKEIWKTEGIRQEWNLSIICPIYKKGDPMDVKNYRGISLLNTAYKILSNTLLNRLRPYANNIIGEYQSGFMSGRSTIDHIFTLKQVIEKYHEFNRPLHLIFIDFKQAYDSVQRTEIWRSLKLLGVPSKLISMMKVSTEGARCAVKFGHEKSEEFQTTTGL